MAQASSQLKQARLEMGLTQLELAVRAGVSSRTIQFAESGRAVASTTLRRIAGALEMECDQILRIDPGQGQDAFMDLPWSAADRFRNNQLSQQGSFCRDEDEVVNVVRQLRENFKVQIQKWGAAEKQSQALSRDASIDRTYFRYEQRYLECWRKNPGCIRVDRVDETICGVSIVMPLSEDCFEAFRSGSISWLEISADDIVDESQYILLDSVTEFANQSRRPWYQITQTLSFVALSQVASLATNPGHSDFEMISFSASPLNEQRLNTIGFSSEPTIEPEFGHRILWFGEDTQTLSEKQYLSWSTFLHFASLVKSVQNKRYRRRLMTHLLSAIKRRQLSRWTSQAVSHQAA